MNSIFLKYKRTNITILLLTILVIIIPSSLYRFEGLFIAILFIYSFVFLKGYKNLKELSKSSKSLLLFFLLYLLGFVYTSNYPSQLKYTTQHIAYILLPLSFLSIKINKNEYRKLKKIFVWSTFIFISIAFINAAYSTFITGKSTIYVNASVQSKFSYYGLTRVFKNWHPTYVSLFANTSLIFVLNLYLTQKKYFIGVFLSMFFVVSIFFLNSFIGIIALLLIVLFSSITFIKSNIIKAFILFILAGFVSFFVLKNPFKIDKIEKIKTATFKVTDDQSERNILNLRLVKWKASYEIFKEAPIIGVTSGALKDKLTSYYKKNGYTYAASRRFSSHNQYLYTLASKGIIGLIFLIVVLILGIKNKESLLFILVTSTFFLTEDILERQQGLIFFVFFYVLILHKKDE